MAEPFFRETRAVQMRTVFSGAPCLRLSVYCYINQAVFKIEKTPSGGRGCLLFVVPGAGVEPARYSYRGILSPLRLPISPSGQRGRHHSGCPGNVKRPQSVRSRYTSANGRRWRSPQMPCPSLRIPQATIMLISAPRGRPRIFLTRPLSSPSSGQVS